MLIIKETKSLAKDKDNSLVALIINLKDVPTNFLMELAEEYYTESGNNYISFQNGKGTVIRNFMVTKVDSNDK